MPPPPALPTCTPDIFAAKENELPAAVPAENMPNFRLNVASIDDIIFNALDVPAADLICGRIFAKYCSGLYEPSGFTIHSKAVGAEVGTLVGKSEIVGDGEGTGVGSGDGIGDGSDVGIGVGSGDGEKDGLGDGTGVGAGVGNGVGTIDGIGVGERDGSGVGDDDGNGDGIGVG